MQVRGLVTRMQGAVGADGRANGRGSHTVALGGLRPAVQTFIAGQCPWIQELLEMRLRVGSSLSPCSLGVGVDKLRMLSLRAFP
jgi:hypothetical protein